VLLNKEADRTLSHSPLNVFGTISMLFPFMCVGVETKCSYKVMFQYSRTTNPGDQWWI